MLVSDLVTASGQWNEALIRDVFLSIDASAIIRQPLNPTREDCWAWEKERFGVYTVKSAYKLLHSVKMENIAGHSPSSSDGWVWKAVWRLPVPPKVRVFWWRVLKEFLPARAVLHRRHIDSIAYCEVCGNPEESIMHVLLECSVEKEFWNQIKMMTGLKILELNPATWASDLLLPIWPERDRALILCGMWALWQLRNNRRHGENGMSLHRAVTWAQDTAFDLWNLFKPDSVAGVREPPKWKPPDPGVLKINTDAAFCAQTSKGATACVMRDHQGGFVLASAKWYDNILDAGMGEAIACRDAVLLATQMGFQKIHLETDCLELVQIWGRRDMQRSIIAPVLSELDEFRLAFSEFMFTFTSRNCNKVASAS